PSDHHVLAPEQKAGPGRSSAVLRSIGIDVRVDDGVGTVLSADSVIDDEHPAACRSEGTLVRGVEDIAIDNDPPGLASDRGSHRQRRVLRRARLSLERDEPDSLYTQ